VTPASGGRPANKDPVSDEGDSRERWKHGLEWWDAGVRTATLIAVVIYTVVSCNQWKEVVRSVDETKRSADAAQGQLTLLTQERRAWVTPFMPGEYTFTADKPIKFNVLIRNVGKIIARDVVTEFTAAVYPRVMTDLPKTIHTDQAPTLFKRGVSQSGLLVPGDATLVYTYLGLGKDVLPDILAGTRTLVIYGTTTYTDEVSTKGSTGFCRAYAAVAKTFDICPNVADWAK
jgi:hypothetical protein